MSKINLKTAFLCLSIILVLVVIFGIVLLLFSDTFQSLYNDITGKVRLEERQTAFFDTEYLGRTLGDNTL